MKKLSKALVLAVALTATSHAQQTPAGAGTVQELTGPQGSVMVVRGNETYFLQSNDTLFEGDQVFSRTNGTAVLQLNGCRIELPAAASTIIDGEVCTRAVVLLEEGAQIAGITIGAPAGIGATPILLGLTAAGGVAAAAGGGGGDDTNTPASP